MNLNVSKAIVNWISFQFKPRHLNNQLFQALHPQQSLLLADFYHPKMLGAGFGLLFFSSCYFHVVLNHEVWLHFLMMGYSKKLYIGWLTFWKKNWNKFVKVSTIFSMWHNRHTEQVFNKTEDHYLYQTAYKLVFIITFFKLIITNQTMASS